VFVCVRICSSLVAFVVGLVAGPIHAQVVYSGPTLYTSGQTVAPAFEGWEHNPDGSSNMVFGYFNRNLDEHLLIPVGPDNNIEPGGPDQGQPTYFLPRRNRFAFRVRVPKDFGSKELVWTLTIRGKTEKAYATLRPDYVIDDQIMMVDVGNFGRDEALFKNKAPTVAIEGETRRTVKVGGTLSLVATASDDGIPKARPAPRGRAGQPVGRSDALGLRVSWFVYRGPGDAVTFTPAQFKAYPDYRSDSPWTPGWIPPPLPADGRFPVSMTFARPGTYVVRVIAHDGGLSSTRDVTVNVTP
jgi:hypothetical protein